MEERILTPQEEVNEAHTIRKTFEILIGLLQVMKVQLHIRESELLYGLILLERFLNKSPSEFDLQLNNLPMTFVVCIMLAHKMSTDRPIKNSLWSGVFKIPLSYLNQSEIFVLKAIDYNLNITWQSIFDLVQAILKA